MAAADKHTVLELIQAAAVVAAAMLFINPIRWQKVMCFRLLSVVREKQGIIKIVEVVVDQEVNLLSKREVQQLYMPMVAAAADAAAADFGGMKAEVEVQKEQQVAYRAVNTSLVVMAQEALEVLVRPMKTDPQVWPRFREVAKEPRVISVKMEMMEITMVAVALEAKATLLSAGKMEVMAEPAMSVFRIRPCI